MDQPFKQGLTAAGLTLFFTLAFCWVLSVYGWTPAEFFEGRAWLSPLLCLLAALTVGLFRYAFAKIHSLEDRVLAMEFELSKR